MKRSKFPVCMSFDVDCQTIWTARDKEYYKKPVMLSLGNYGAYEGVPSILRILKKYGIKATFNVPGEVADLFPELILKVFGEGHEIGNHGYTHVWPENFETRKDEYDEYYKANKRIEELTGIPPVGFRSPAWEFSEHTPEILEELGIKYSSNMMHTDKIHRLKIGNKEKKIIEIPIHWAMDDAAYWLYSTKLVGKAMQPMDAVEQVFTRQFDVLYDEWKSVEGREDTVYVLTCHPQVIGVPARSAVLENVIKHICKYEDAEFMRMADLAENYSFLIDNTRR